MDKVFKCLGATNHAVGERAKDDFYSTPEYVTDKVCGWLKKNIPESLNWKIWEPAAGNGRMINSLKNNGFNVTNYSDIVDRGLPGVEIADFLEAEKKENIDCIFTNPPYKCFSSDTECYTQEGWKFIKDVKKEDKILSVSPDDLELEWSEINGFVEYEVNEELYHFKKSHMDILCTEGHRMFAFDKNGLVKKNNDLIKSENIRSTHYIPRNGYRWSKKEGPDCFILPGIEGSKYAQPSYKEEIKIEINDWLNFFGLWLADGYCRHTKNSNGNYRKTVGIKQECKKAEKVRAILNRLPFEYKEYLDKNRETPCYNFEIHNEQLWSYLKQFGKSEEKFIPLWLKELPQENLKNFLDAYFFGDGSIYTAKEVSGRIYRSISKKLIEDIQEILLKLGSLTHIVTNTYKTKNNEVKTLYSINYSPDSKYNKIFYPSAKKSKEHYSGKVVCLNLKKNGIFLLRRNGMEFVSGNCATEFAEKAMDLLEDEGYYIMLGRIQFLEGKKRGKLFDKYPPKHVLIFRERVDCWKDDIETKTSGALCYAFFIFKKGFKGKPTIDWI